jgi:uncharacterized protein (TIGR02145 family)
MDSRILKVILIFIAFYSQYRAQTIMNIHQNNGTVLQLPLNTIDSITYTINNPGNLSTILTNPIINITANSAETGGVISSDGGSIITQKGICWSTSPNPTTANFQTNDGNGNSNFISVLNSLTSNTTYYIKAFAINSAGTAYGNEISFTTNFALPTVNTLIIGNITGNSAVSGGEVINDGGSPIMQRGICWSILPNPTLLDSFTNDGNGIGVFNSTLNNLNPNTLYYIRSYASNIAGTSYGNEINFSTSMYFTGLGVNYDGYNYGSIILPNGQEWFTENLRTTIYSNGDPIPNDTIGYANGSLWSNLSSGAWINYQNDIQYENTYGKLYCGYAVNDSRNVCPSGWHVPSENDWNTFVIYVEPSADTTTGIYNQSNNGIKFISTSLGGNNASGFDVNYGGFYSVIQGWNPNVAKFWTSTNYNNGMRNRSISINGISNGGQPLTSGHSIRCIKD